MANILSKIHVIQVLSLAGNTLGDSGVKCLAKGIMDTISLYDVNISDNGFGVEGLDELGKALEVNKSLRVMDISGN